MIATICGNWKLPINVDLKDENDLGLHSRSYIHYVTSRKDLVSAKCWATKWLLEGLELDVPKEPSAIEYFAGVGVMTTIIRNLYDLTNHFVLERDEECCQQLRKSFPDITVGKADFKQIAEMEATYDFKFLDFPSSSIAQMHTKWKIDNFLNMFESSPTLVVWTDTSVCYPMTLHGKSYSKYFLTNREIKTEEAYLEEYSRWLEKKTGYSITRVAKRATNALYIAAQYKPGASFEYKKFPASNDGFTIDG